MSQQGVPGFPQGNSLYPNSSQGKTPGLPVGDMGLGKTVTSTTDASWFTGLNSVPQFTNLQLGAVANFNGGNSNTITLLENLRSGLAGRERVQIIVQGTSLSKGKDTAQGAWPEVMIKRLRGAFGAQTTQMAICGTQNEAADSRIVKSAGVDYDNAGIAGAFGSGYIRFNTIGDNITINSPFQFDTVDLTAFTNASQGNLDVSFDNGATYPNSLATAGSLGVGNTTTYTGTLSSVLKIKLSVATAGRLACVNLRNSGNPTLELLNGAASGSTTSGWAANSYSGDTVIAKLAAVSGVKFIYAVEFGINEAILASRQTVSAFTAALTTKFNTLLASGSVMYIIPHCTNIGADGTGANGYLMPDGFLNTYYDAAITLCKSLNIPVFDGRVLFPAYRALPTNYWLDNVHPTFRLTTRLGTAIADALAYETARLTA